MAAGTQGRKRILVVDDCPATREILATILEVEGYEVASAADGRAALAYLNSSPPPDVILLDLMMPVLSGWDFLALRRKDPQWASIPVIVLSALGDAEPELEGLDVAACITKPINEDRLIDSVVGTVAAVLARGAPVPSP